MLVDIIHPGYLTAEATVGRVQAFHDLLHDTKMDQPQASVIKSAGPVDQAARAQAEAQKGHDDAAKKIRNREFLVTYLDAVQVSTQREREMKN